MRDRWTIYFLTSRSLSSDEGPDESQQTLRYEFVGLQQCNISLDTWQSTSRCWTWSRCFFESMINLSKLWWVISVKLFRFSLVIYPKPVFFIQKGSFALQYRQWLKEPGPPKLPAGPKSNPHVRVYECACARRFFVIQATTIKAGNYAHICSTQH